MVHDTAAHNAGQDVTSNAATTASDHSNLGSRHIDLCGEWPIINRREFHPGREIPRASWLSLSGSERAEVVHFLEEKGRVVKEYGRNDMIHVAADEQAELDCTVRKFEFMVTSDSVRHASLITFLVDTDNDFEAEECEVLIRQFVADLAVVGFRRQE
jgi:hypothetical protein